MTTPLHQTDIPQQLMREWQAIVDLIVRLTAVKVGLVMQVVSSDIAVLIASKTPNNPYQVGEREHLEDSGLYCETVIKMRAPLQVPNALEDPLWEQNPDLKHGLVAYLGFPICFPDGRILGTLCVLDDKENNFFDDIIALMSKMKELIENQLGMLEENRQQRLFAKEGFLRQILDHLPVAIACCTSAVPQRTLYLNQTCASMLGFTTTAPTPPLQWPLLGTPDTSEKDLASSVWPDLLATVLQQPGITLQQEFGLSRTDGGFVDVLVACVLINDMLVISLTDISERKRNEERLQAREERLELVLSGSELGFWDWDIAQDCVVFDKRALQILGYEDEAPLICLDDWQKNLHQDDRKEVQEKLQQHLNGNLATYEVEYRQRHLRGHWVWIQDRGRVVVRYPDGRPRRMTGTYLDTTSRKQLEGETTHLLRQIEDLMRKALHPTPVGEGPVTEVSSTDSRLERLTRRQKEILCLVASGMTSAEIALKLNIATDTVETHRRDLMRKLDIRSVAGLTRLAIQAGLLKGVK